MYLTLVCNNLLLSQKSHYNTNCMKTVHPSSFTSSIQGCRQVGGYPTTLVQTTKLWQNHHKWLMICFCKQELIRIIFWYSTFSILSSDCTLNFLFQFLHVLVASFFTITALVPNLELFTSTSTKTVSPAQRHKMTGS